MTLGIGSLASVSSIAFCRPSASVAPATTWSTNRLSALPSGWRLSDGHGLGAEAQRRSFLSSAGEALPSLSKATAAGISFCSSARSAALAATPVTCTPRRRGDAKPVATAASAPTRPAACRLATSVVGERLAQLLQRLRRQFLADQFDEEVLGVLRAHARLPSSFRSGRRLRRPRPWAPSGSRGARGSRGSSARRRAPGCGCGRCRRRVR